MFTDEERVEEAKMTYIIIAHADIKKFSKLITDKLNEGWSLVGVVSVDKNRYYQAMILDREKSQPEKIECPQCKKLIEKCTIAVSFGGIRTYFCELCNYTWSVTENINEN